MKALAAALLAAATILSIAAPPASAQWTGQQLGNFTFWNGPGRTVTCQQIGQFTFCN